MAFNGRVNIMSKPSHEYQFMIEQPNAIRGDYVDATVGQQLKNEVSNLFFSQFNIDVLQHGIKAGVYNKSHKTILVGEQDENTLRIIMRSIYFQFGKNLPGNVKEQVRELNRAVLDYAVPNVLGEAQAYMKYKRDVSTLAMPHELPKPTYNKGNRQLEQKRWF